MKAKDVFIIPYLPFVAMGFLVASIAKAFMAGADLADKFTKWGAKR